MKHFHILAMLLCGALAAETALQFPNAGFEEKTPPWKLNQFCRIIPEAAHTGKFGLRIEDNDNTDGASVFAPQIDVAAGTTMVVPAATSICGANTEAPSVLSLSSMRRPNSPVCAASGMIRQNWLSFQGGVFSSKPAFGNCKAVSAARAPQRSMARIWKCFMMVQTLYLHNGIGIIVMKDFLQNLRRIFNTSRNTDEKTAVIISCKMKEPALFH